MISDRRGVSEAIGFVLVFSLVLLTVSTVFTLGYSGLQDARDAERVNNAERAFDVLANNIEDVSARGAPSRGTEIRLAEARLGSGPPTQINVSGYHDNGSAAFSPTGNYSIDPIVYEAEGTRIRYAGGAIVRNQSDGSVMLHEPSFVLSEDRAIIPVVQLSVTDREIAGSRTVLVRAERRLRSVDVDEREIDQLEIALTTPEADRWAAYLDEKDGVSCDPPAGDRVVCETDDPERVTVIHVEIAVSFD
ncbi:MAG: DUF7289 family protein [Halolamina sp.]